MGDSNDEAALGADLATRMTRAELSLSNIETTMQCLLVTQNQPNTSANQGDRSKEDRLNLLLQWGQGHSSEDPNFIPVSSSSASQGAQAQGCKQ